MRNETDFERELDNRAFALQCDVLKWRVARMHSLPYEEQRKQYLESLSKLRDLLTELEVFLTDRQEGRDQQLCKNGTDCVLHAA